MAKGNSAVAALRLFVFSLGVDILPTPVNRPNCQRSHLLFVLSLQMAKFLPEQLVELFLVLLDHRQQGVLFDRGLSDDGPSAPGDTGMPWPLLLPLAR